MNERLVQEICFSHCETFYNVMMQRVADAITTCLKLNNTCIENQQSLAYSFTLVAKGYKRTISAHHLQSSMECVEVKQERCLD